MNWTRSTLSPVQIDAKVNSNSLDFICASELSIDDRGVDLLIFIRIRDILRKWAYPASYWSIHNVKQQLLYCNESSAIVNDSRYINPISSLTGIYKCSLIQMLELDSTNAHPDLGVSYYDVVRNKANVYISFPYTMNYFELVEALEDFAKDKTNVSFWFEPFNINFWDITVNTNILKAKNIITSKDCLLSIIDNWDNPSITNRVWMIFELYCAYLATIKIEFACCSANTEYFKLNYDTVSTMTITDISILKAYNYQDKLNISAFFKRVGTKNIEKVFKKIMKRAIKLFKSRIKVEKVEAKIEECEIETVPVQVKPKYQNIIKFKNNSKNQESVSVEPSNLQYYHEQIEKIHKLYEDD